jgi:hypothetical protein
MTRIITTISLILTLAFCQPVFGQGRVATNPVLHNIWLTTQKIDNDPTNLFTLTSISSQKDSIEYTAYYSKNDTIFKVARLSEIISGTQLTTYYYDNNKPIFISVKRNNYPFSGEKLHFSKTVHSFDDVVDTNLVQKKSLYKATYQAKYFFYQGKVRHSNIITDKFTRVDNKKDIAEALKMYEEAKSYLTTKL